MFSDDEICWLFLTLTGFRRATRIGAAVYHSTLDDYNGRESWAISPEKSIPFVDLFSYLDVGSHITVDEHQWYDDDEGLDKIIVTVEYTIFADPNDEDMWKFLEMNNPIDPDTYDDEFIGEVLGYPDWAIDSFLAGGQSGLTGENAYQYGLNHGFSKNEVQYMNFNAFGVREDIVAVEKAIAYGKQSMECLESLADQYDFLDGLEDVVERLFEYEPSPLRGATE